MTKGFQLKINPEAFTVEASVKKIIPITVHNMI